jgi:hypothetical protein
MMTSTEIDRALADEESDRRAKVERALELGGMPTLAEISKAEAALAKAYNVVERLVWRLDGITSAFHEELSSPVTMEHVGLAASFAYTLDLEIWQFQKAAESVKSTIGALDELRAEMA